MQLSPILSEISWGQPALFGRTCPRAADLAIAGLIGAGTATLENFVLNFVQPFRKMPHVT